MPANSHVGALAGSTDLHLQSKTPISCNEIGLEEATLTFALRSDVATSTAIPVRGTASVVEGYTHLGKESHQRQINGFAPGVDRVVILYQGRSPVTYADDEQDSWEAGSIDMAMPSPQTGLAYKRVTYRAKSTTSRYMASARPSAPAAGGTPTIVIDGAVVTLPYAYDFGPADVTYSAQPVLTGFTVIQRGNAFEVNKTLTGKIVETWNGGFPPA